MCKQNNDQRVGDRQQLVKCFYTYFISSFCFNPKSKHKTFSFLKCICNENFDVGFFAFSENLVFSDHKNTNLVEKFEPEVC